MPPVIPLRRRGRPRPAVGHARAAGGAQEWRTTATTVAGIVSVLLVAAGLFYTNVANRKQQDLALQGQVADRFSAAIDHLGQEDQQGRHDKLSIRLGGIYALERLMVDSERDEPAVVQVLCAFVRTHASRPAVRPKTVTSAPADVRATVAVLGSRPNPGGNPLDFSNTLLGLDNADLNGTDLTYADLTGADLTGAWLSDADLAYADLTGADLTGAFLTGADLTGADLTGAIGATSDQLSYAQVNQGTRLPEGLSRPAPSPSRSR
jgi:hypothetical protein